MVYPSTQHLLAILMILSASDLSQPADARRYHMHQTHGGFYNQPWPAAFLHYDTNRGAFRPFDASRRHWGGRNRGAGAGAGGGRGGSFSTVAPLVDMFQEVFGDFKKAVAQEIVDGTSPRAPPHELVETATSVTLYVDLPGCKKQDVDAQILEDTGAKTLKITAVRKKPYHGGSDKSGTATRSEEQSGAGSETEDPSPSSKEDGSASPGHEETFELTFRIGEGIDAAGVRGTMEDGVLKLVIPKVAPEPPAKPIEVPIDPPSATDFDGDRETGARASADASDNTHISLT